MAKTKTSNKKKSTAKVRSGTGGRKRLDVSWKRLAPAVVLVALVGGFLAYRAFAASAILALPGSGTGSTECTRAGGTVATEASGSKRNAKVCQLGTNQTLEPIIFGNNRSTSTTQSQYFTLSSGATDTGYIKLCYAMKKVGNNATVTIGGFTSGSSTRAGTSRTVSNDDYNMSNLLCDPVAQRAGSVRPFIRVTAGTVRVASISISETPAPATSGTTNPISGRRCELWLHSAGGGGGSSYVDSEGDLVLRPQSTKSDGSAYNFWEYDGPHNYAYDPGVNSSEVASYNRIVNQLTSTLSSNGCGATVVLGQSAGGGLAAKMYCRGETLGNRAFAFIVDDPVIDNGVRNTGGCKPGATVKHSQFTHSTEMQIQADRASTGNHCSWDPPYWWQNGQTVNSYRQGQGTGWYCEDNRTMSLNEYQQIIGQTSYWHRPNHSDGNGANSYYDNYPSIARAWARL
jgi:hypothetical protein